MYLLPIGVEHMNEQNKIMMKIQMSMMSGADGAVGAPWKQDNAYKDNANYQ